MTKKILISLSVIGIVAAMVIGGTIAYFSDTETSTGNTFTAGAIDLKIDNDSWYNGELRQDLGWELDELTGHLFFDYEDLKPGDWGEDTVSLHVFDNDAWACVDLYITKNDDMSSTEPELEAGDVQEDPQNIWDGELAKELQFIFWVDDGDNVLEVGENVLLQGSASAALQSGLHYTLADAYENNIGGSPEDPLIGGQTYYIGKAWCYGVLLQETQPQDGDNSPLIHPGITCNGEPVSNKSQTDNMMVDVSFYVEQARNNAQFQCSSHYEPVDMKVQDLENKDDSWVIKANDGIYGTLVYSTDASTFHGTVVGQGLEKNAKYQITLNGPGSCTVIDDNLANFGANLFQSGYWDNNWSPNLASTCSGTPGEGIYNMNLTNDHYTVMSDAMGNLSYSFNLALPSGTYSDVKVLVKKMLDDHVTPWVDSSTEHTTNLFETAAITFTVQ